MNITYCAVAQWRYTTLAKRYEELSDALETLALHFRFEDRGRLARACQLASSELRTAEHIPVDPSNMDDVSVRIRDYIAEWRAFGEIPKLTEFEDKRPYLSNLCQVAKVGPTTAENLHVEKDISTVDDIRELDESGELEDVTGIGPKTATTIRRSIAQMD